MGKARQKLEAISPYFLGNTLEFVLWAPFTRKSLFNIRSQLLLSVMVERDFSNNWLDWKRGREDERRNLIQVGEKRVDVIPMKLRGYNIERGQYNGELKANLEQNGIKAERGDRDSLHCSNNI